MTVFCHRNILLTVFINVVQMKIIFTSIKTIVSYLNKHFLGRIDWDNLIILPNSLSKIIWDSYILFLLSLNIFYVPIKITWEDSSMGGLKLNSLVKIFLNDLPGWTFLVDIFLNFNAAYYSKG